MHYLDEFSLVYDFGLDLFLNIGTDLFLHEIVLLLDSLDFDLAFFVLFVESGWFFIQQAFTHVVVHFYAVFLWEKIVDRVSRSCWEITNYKSIFIIFDWFN